MKLWDRFVETIQEWWRAFVNTLSSLYASCIAFFSKKKAAPIEKIEENPELPPELPIEKIEENPELPIGKQFYFMFEGCSHLVYLVSRSDEAHIELLGLRFVSDLEAEEVVFKKLDDLKTMEEQRIAYREKNLILVDSEANPFYRMLQGLVEWAREQHIPHVVLTREIDFYDVTSVVEYFRIGFKEVYDEAALREFKEELNAFKGRLEKLLFHRNKSPKNGLFFNFLSQQQKADLSIFREMIGFIGVALIDPEGRTLDFSELHKCWRFWDEFDFLPRYRIALDVNYNRVPDPLLYRSMRVTLSLADLS